MTNMSTKPLRLDHRIGITLHRVVTKGLLRRSQSLFLLGTMRSGSTVLTNILISHDDIAGFAESMLVYDRPARLLDLRYWTFRYMHRYPSFKKRLFDKILHNHLLPQGFDPFDPEQTHLIFLVRSPASTARSIAKMFSDIGDAYTTDHIWALLADRYLKLAELSTQAAGRFPIAALSYEALVSEPDAALVSLSDFLDLSTPLTRRYKVQRWVGRWGLGDGSDNIKKGELIAKTRPPVTYNDVPDQVRDAYEALLQTLKDTADITQL